MSQPKGPALFLSALFVLLILAAAGCSLPVPGLPSAPSSLTLATPSFAGGTSGQPYFQRLDAKGGAKPYRWKVAKSSSLPPGLALNATAGTIAGTPAQAGIFSLTVVVTDRAGRTASRSYVLRVAQEPYSFSPPVRATMDYLEGKTTVPLWAPMGPRPELSGYSAWVHVATAGKIPSYRVHIGQCPVFFPRTIVFGSGNCPGAVVNLVSGFSFGGNIYPSAADARSTLDGLSTSRLTAPGPALNLGHGVTGRNPGGIKGLLYWREDGWTFAVDYSAFTPGGRRSNAKETAQSIVAYVATHTLPLGPGDLLTAGSGGDASSGATVVYRAVGKTVFQTSTSGYAPLTTLSLMVALRPYPKTAGAQATGTPPTSSGAAPPSGAAAVAHDEAVISAQYGQCRAFFVPNGCPFGSVAQTSDGSGGHLYGVLLTQSTGDACFRGIAYFFDGEKPVGSSQENVVALQSDGPGRFAVGYAVSNPKVDPSCAGNGSAGTDTYVYGWNGSAVVKISGSPPPPPEVIGP